MTELTPELLTQLEQDAAGFAGRFEARFKNCSDTVQYVDVDGLDHEIIADCGIDDVVEPLARMLNAVSPLVAAAKERDQLRVEVKRTKREIANIRSALDAHGHDGTFEAAAKLHAEVERLRELGLAACNWLESSSDKAARRFYAARLRVEISKGPP